MTTLGERHKPVTWWIGNNTRVNQASRTTYTERNMKREKTPAVGWLSWVKVDVRVPKNRRNCKTRSRAQSYSMLSFITHMGDLALDKTAQKGGIETHHPPPIERRNTTE